MSRLPRLTGKQIVAIFKKLGFEAIRQRGSHIYLKHPDGRSTVVPLHSGETIGPGLMHKILTDAEVSRNEFIKYT
jgi:predicted RNA binding protein YcfA (HicA-like mRNA interferase family)